MPRGKGPIKKYTRVQRRDALLAVQKGEPIVRVAKDFNIHPTTLAGWVSKARKSGDNSLYGKTSMKLPAFAASDLAARALALSDNALEIASLMVDAAAGLAALDALAKALERMDTMKRDATALNDENVRLRAQLVQRAVAVYGEDTLNERT